VEGNEQTPVCVSNFCEHLATVFCLAFQLFRAVQTCLFSCLVEAWIVASPNHAADLQNKGRHTIPRQVFEVSEVLPVQHAAVCSHSKFIEADGVQLSV